MTRNLIMAVALTACSQNYEKDEPFLGNGTNPTDTTTDTDTSTDTTGTETSTETETETQTETETETQTETETEAQYPELGEASTLCAGGGTHSNGSLSGAACLSPVSIGSGEPSTNGVFTWKPASTVFLHPQE